MFFLYLATISPSSFGRLPWNFATWSETGCALWCMSENSGSSRKKWAKSSQNMQHFGRFYTTSGFDRENLQNESMYPKSERHVIESHSSAFYKKSGELRSTEDKELRVNLDPPTWNFWETTCISALMGVLYPQIFTRARDWPGLASAHLNRVGRPLPKNYPVKF